MLFDDKAKLIADADRCVMCGLCSPRCPTYQKTRDEAESPRGRIALISALAGGQLPVTTRLQAHVDSCLLCGACESACPSGAPVTALIDRARAAMTAGRQRSWRARLVDRALSRPGPMRLAGQILRWGERSGLRRLARYGGATTAVGLDIADARLPEIPARPRLHHRYPAAGQARGDVALFRGCASTVFDTATLLDAVHVLNRLGINVHIPSDQVCCGALHQHNGAPQIAAGMARQNIQAFGRQKIDAITGIASGCTVMLADYRTVWNGAPGAADFAGRVRDINRFLVTLAWPADAGIAPLRKRVAIHVPCSQAFGLRDAASTVELLEKIPDVELVELPGSEICCGAAGTHMLTHGEMADALRADKLAALARIAPDILVTSNIGCALHFRHGMRQAGLDIEVLHPVALLRRQMD